MKKKTWLILIVLLLILLIPIPSGTYKDGGTRAYTALTYKIVKWKRLVDTGGFYEKTRFYPFPQNFKSIGSLWYQEERHMEKKEAVKSDSAEEIALTDTDKQAEIDDLLYNEREFRNDYLKKGSYTLYKDLLDEQVPKLEKILVLCNSELLETIAYEGTDVVIDIPKDGNYQLIAVDTDGNQTDITHVTIMEVKSTDDSPILFLDK